MDLRKLQDYYKRCDPAEPLEAEDARYADIDEFGDPEHRVRGESWTNLVATQIALSGANSVCRYFTGLRGSGKSTELRRLAHRMSRGELGVRLLPVSVEATRELQMNAPIDIPDLMTVLVHRAEEAVLAVEAAGKERAGGSGAIERLWSWITGKDAHLKGVTLEGGPAQLTRMMRDNPELRARVRGAVEVHLSPFLAEVHEEILRLNERVQRIGYSGLLLIFDSLEKLSGTGGDQDRRVLQSAEEVFASEDFLQLPAHVIYTFPVGLIFRLSMTDKMFIMPMIKLRERDGREPFEPGYRAARDMIRRRIPDEDLAHLLGHDQVEARVRELIAWSAGYPREIMRMLRFVLELGAAPGRGAPLSGEAFRSIFSRLSDRYRDMVYGHGQPAIDWLARVAVTHQPRQDNPEERDIGARMLGSNMVLRYQNRERWWDIHPVLEDIPEIQQAMQRIHDGGGTKDGSMAAKAAQGEDAAR